LKYKSEHGYMYFKLFMIVKQFTSVLTKKTAASSTQVILIAVDGHASKKCLSEGEIRSNSTTNTL
jgi:hypothetical protein